MIPQGLPAIRRILVYTDGEVIGDGIIRLPFAIALKAAAPDATLTWLTGTPSVYANALALMANTAIDRLLTLPAHRVRLRDLLTGPPRFAPEPFDLIIDTQRNTKRSFWLWRIPHRRMVSASANGFFSNVGTLPPLSPHFFERIMQMASLGLGQPLTAPPLVLPEGEWLAQAAQLLPHGPRYVGLVVGAGHPDKCWPLAQFKALARHITGTAMVPVFFLGPQETDRTAELQQAFPQGLFPLNTPGIAPSAYLTIALAGRLAAAVANDSGGAHLLAAGGAPLVTLFRSNSVRIKFMPRAPRVIALAPEDFHVARMQEIPLAAVVAALMQQLPTQS